MAGIVLVMKPPFLFPSQPPYLSNTSEKTLEAMSGGRNLSENVRMTEFISKSLIQSFYLLLAELHIGFALFSVRGATADPDSPLARPLLCGRRDRPLVRHLRRREQHPAGEDGPHQARRAALLCRHRGSFRYISIAEIEKVIGLSVCLQAFVCSLIAPFIDDTDREGECDFELSALLLHRT